VACAEVYFGNKWHLHPSSHLAKIDMGQKLDGGGCALFSGGSSVPSNTKSPGLRPTSIPSGILMHPAVWPQYKWAENWGRLCPPPFWGEELGPHLAQCGVDIHAKCHLDPSSRLATVDMGQKLWRGLCRLFGEGRAGSPSNTKSTGLRPTFVPSGILIHAAVWPQ